MLNKLWSFRKNKIYLRVLGFLSIISVFFTNHTGIFETMAPIIIGIGFIASSIED